MKSKNSTFIYPIIAIFIVFLSLYVAIPKLYLNQAKERTQASFNELVTTLSKGQDITNTLNRYAIEENCYLRLENQATHESQETMIIETQHEYQYQQNLRINQEPYTLTCIYANQALGHLQSILMMTFAIAGLFLMIVIYAVDAFFKPNENDDYNLLYKKTKAMLNLEEDVSLPINNPSPLKNATFKNINEMYGRLLKANQTIRNHRIDLQNAHQSQQMINLQTNARIKGPIDDACRLISQALLSKEAFEDKKIALIEAKLRLESIEDEAKKTVVNHSQEPTSIHQFFKQSIEAHTLEATKHQVGFDFQFEKDFKTTLNTVALSEAIHHLMQFILSQCLDHTNLVIKQNNYDIVISYKGTCLTDQSAELVRETDYHLIRFFKYVSQAKLFADFTATQRKDGMQIVLHF